MCIFLFVWLKTVEKAGIRLKEKPFSVEKGHPKNQLLKDILRLDAEGKHVFLGDANSGLFITLTTWV